MKNFLKQKMWKKKRRITKKKSIFTSLCIIILLMIGSGCYPVKNNLKEDRSSPPDRLFASIQTISDGDTVTVRAESNYVHPEENLSIKKGSLLKVRLLLLDTPESVGPNAGMPFGKEASDFAKRTLSNKTVELEFDEGEKKDHYGRYLAYLYVDGKSFQEMVLREGMGIVRYVQEPNTRYLQEFLNAEKEASEQNKGVWSLPDYAVSQVGYNEVTGNGLSNSFKEDISKDNIMDFFKEAAIDWLKN
ncbi:thermonuclease family protein [Pseudobacillus sp. 179-B 2D1 NHS]|uniref:thermonuclease family protein n=1 Tax=Pseudobacillus sp. 179-B 2D1 NHS TaxID=3374292 RepID=UPI00387980FE